MAKKDIPLTAAGDRYDWRALVAADKDVGGEPVRWQERWAAGVVVCELVRLDFTAVTPGQGRFSLWLEGQHRGDSYSQFQLKVLLPAGRRYALARLCRCRIHASDDYPVHWHRFEDVPGEKADPVEPVLSLPPGTIDRETVLDEFLSTMKVTNYQRELAP